MARGATMSTRREASEYLVISSRQWPQAAWTYRRGLCTHVASGMGCINTLPGDVHAEVTCGRHRGNEKNDA
jgi:hypothetical protein